MEETAGGGTETWGAGTASFLADLVAPRTENRGSPGLRRRADEDDDDWEEEILLVQSERGFRLLVLL